MAQRRKLLADKILDGSVRLFLGGEVAESLVVKGLGAQKFVIDENLFIDIYNSFRGHNDYLDAVSSKSPYDVIWLENSINRAWIIFTGNASELLSLLNTNDAGMLSNMPTNCLDEMSLVISIVDVDNGFQVLPHVVLRSRFPGAKGGSPYVVAVLDPDRLIDIDPTDKSVPECELSINMSLVPPLIWYALNVKNATSSEFVTVPENLAKARVKREKPTLSNYTYIRSNMTPSASTGTGGTKAAHLVRGHFKRRKTGVYWWKPHVAGSGELKERKAYIV